MSMQLAILQGALATAVVVTGCKSLALKQSTVLESKQLDWAVKDKIYDFSKICPLDRLKWRPGMDPAQYLSAVVEGATLVQDSIPGSDSGVVVSQEGATRDFYEKIFPSCGPEDGGIALRFTIDRIPGNQYAYELFVKDLHYCPVNYRIISAG